MSQEAQATGGRIMMVGSNTTKQAVTLEFVGGDVAAVADKVAIFLSSRGYRLESGDRTQGVYGRGSAVGNVLAGALGGRQRFSVTIARNGEKIAVIISRAMTGWSGGMIGVSVVKKELQAITTGMQSFLLQQ